MNLQENLEQIRKNSNLMSWSGCGNCSRRNFYQIGYKDGLKKSEKELQELREYKSNKDLFELLEWIDKQCNLCEENLEKEKVFLAVAERECIEDDEQFIIEKSKKMIIKWENRLDTYQMVENHIEGLI